MFYLNFSDNCSMGSNWHYDSTVSDNGLAPNMRQNNDDLIYRCIYASLDKPLSEAMMESLLHASIKIRARVSDYTHITDWTAVTSPYLNGKFVVLIYLCHSWESCPCHVKHIWGDIMATKAHKHIHYPTYGFISNQSVARDLMIKIDFGDSSTVRRSKCPSCWW